MFLRHRGLGEKCGSVSKMVKWDIVKMCKRLLETVACNFSFSQRDLEGKFVEVSGRNEVGDIERSLNVII